MSITDFFEPYGSESVIFDPMPAYDGDWIFSILNLLKNAKKENGKNLFEEFYKKTYQQPLEDIFKTPRILDFKVGMISSPNDNNIGRCLKYSKIDFFVEMTSFLNQAIDRYGKTDEQHNEYLLGLVNNIEKDNETLNIAYAEALKEKAEKLKGLIDGDEFNSPYFEAAVLDHTLYMQITGKKISFSDYIKISHKITTEFQQGMLKLGDFFDKVIDYKEMSKAFEPDVFYLLFAKIIYEYNLKIERETGKLDNSYIYMHYYNTAVGEVSKSTRRYDPKITYKLSSVKDSYRSDDSGKNIIYSRYGFQNDFQKLMERHPEAQVFHIANFALDNKEKYRDIDLMEKLKTIYDGDARVNWEFLPAGEGIKKGNRITHDNVVKGVKKDKDELVKEVNMRITILENSGFVGRPIKGLNTFTGYYAFVYPNGKVILEKFWENEETMNPSDGNATYVMNIDNFVNMSKISKTTLMEYIKTMPEIGVKRIFHTSINNWQRNLYNEINGTYRLEDAIAFISSLKSGALSNE